MFDDNDVATLNSLIETTIDSADGYREAAENANDAQLRSTFQRMAMERGEAAQGLKTAVTALGGTPDEDGTILASAHRMFLDLRAKIAGREDKAIVEEVERGEDHIKGKYETAMREEGLKPETRAAIETAYASVRKGHDMMSETKHRMQATA